MNDWLDRVNLDSLMIFKFEKLIDLYGNIPYICTLNFYMGQIAKTSERIETRLSKVQKELFLQAVELGGYRSLTDFILEAAQDKATHIIQQNQMIIASKKDAEILIKALLNPKPPNKNLKNALNDFINYKKK